MRSRRSPLLPALLLALLAMLASGASTVAAEMVTYTDSRGTVHMVERDQVPAAYRDQLRRQPTGGRVSIVGEKPAPSDSRRAQPPPARAARAAPARASADAPRALARTPSAAESAAASLVPELSWTAIFTYLVTNFWVSVFVLAGCCLLIQERVENLGLWACFTVFLQRGALLAFWIFMASAGVALASAQAYQSFGDFVRALLFVSGAGLVITAFLLRIWITNSGPRAVVLSALFTTLDGTAQGLLLLLCFAVFS